MKNIEDFNDLPQTKRSEIYFELKEKFSKENLQYFLTQKNSLLIAKNLENKTKQENSNIILSSDFSISHWKIFNELFDFDKLTEVKKETIKEILADISRVIVPIKEYNKKNLCFDISVGLAGGAIRDLVLMDCPEIKDLDLIVSFKYKPELILMDFNANPKMIAKDLEFLISQIKKENKILHDMGMKEFDLTNVGHGIDLSISIEKFVFHTVGQYLEKYLHVENHYLGNFKNTVAVEKLVNNLGSENRHLSGVIKIKDKSLNYDIDVLLTSITVNSYLNAFDYSICKMIVYILDEDKDFMHNKEQSERNFFSSIVISPEIYDDIMDRTLTFNTERFSKEEIERSLQNHYPRLKAKYPDFRLSLKSKTDSHSQEYLNSLMLMHNLQDVLSSKEQSVNKNKIKV